MTTPVFTWPVDVGTGADFDYQVNEIQLGDGYNITQGRGIHTERQVWNVSMFVDRLNPSSPGNQALAFLRARKGYQTFQWTNPYGETILVKCKGLKDTSNGATTFTMQATFEQTWEP